MPTLRNLREANYLSRRELAELANVSSSTIVRMEEGIQHTKEDIARKVVHALSLAIGQKLSLEDLEGMKVYNIMRDRRHRRKGKQSEEGEQP